MMEYQARRCRWVSIDGGEKMPVVVGRTIFVVHGHKAARSACEYFGEATELTDKNDGPPTSVDPEEWRGRHVVLIAGQSEQQRQYMRDVAELVHPHAASLWLVLPHGECGGYIRSWDEKELEAHLLCAREYSGRDNRGTGFYKSFDIKLVEEIECRELVSAHPGHDAGDIAGVFRLGRY